MEGKEAFFKEIKVGDRSVFECTICGRHLSRKQRVLTHLRNVHDKSPLKKVYRKYVDDPSVPVPRRTARRLQRLSAAADLPQASSSFDYDSDETYSSKITTADYSKDDQCEHDNVTIDHCSPEKISQPESSYLDSSPMSVEGYLDKSSCYSNEDITINSPNATDDDFSSCNSSPVSNDDDSSSCDSDSSDSSIKSYSSNDSQGKNVDFLQKDKTSSLPQEEFQALSLVSCFLRNKFSASTCKDVIDTFKATFPHCDKLSNLDFRKIMSTFESDDIKEYHYCIFCNKIFPPDEDIFRCDKPNCDGLRYKGGVSKQQSKGRQPQQCFVFTDIKKQLVSLLKTPGLWEDIQKNREASYRRKEELETVLTDISDGAIYRKMMVEGGFLDKIKYNVTAMFNTDGVNLYSSSKIELWPIFLAINELSPSLRFSRSNIILLGMWQGKGKPPFQEYLSIFAEEMNSLYLDGVEVNIDGNTYNVKMSVLCGIADLPAKAEMLNMSYYNGEYACITCEDPGKTVKQGKGHAKSFPYRDQGTKYPARTQEKIIENMDVGTAKKRSKGFKGRTSLTLMNGFNIVDGTVPDYMHGVLLGVTKTLLVKWFSSSECQKQHFIGKNIKTISKRMNNIKPPSGIERLPRDLEKHYLHFKATELQSWLLFYAVPCLNGFLGDDYMENLVCLSQAVYLLLGDQISTACLESAVDLLDQFYGSFQRLYGDGSCGLNVHNSALHLPYYVKLWGPAWCWSCFPFEDANAMLLQAVHGTGNVLKQAMKYRQAQLHICKKGMDVKKSSAWKTTEATNCEIAGVPQKLGDSESCVISCLAKLHPNACSDPKKVFRIVVNGKKFISEGYGRMQKRICNIVSYSGDEIGNIKYFVMCDNIVYAVLTKMEKIPASQIPGTPLVSHLTAVKDSETLFLVNVDQLCDVLVFIDTRIHPNSVDPCFVCKLPNRHGHAVFK